MAGKLAESDLLNNDRKVQECDARGDAVSNEAGEIMALIYNKILQ